MLRTPRLRVSLPALFLLRPHSVLVLTDLSFVRGSAVKGCCNDARIISKILDSKGFDAENVRLIVDDDDSVADPSGVEVKKALDWLCTDRHEDDIIFFHFSGHGTQVPSDGDDQEADGKDEAIVLEQMFLMAVCSCISKPIGISLDAFLLTLFFLLVLRFIHTG